MVAIKRMEKKNADKQKTNFQCLLVERFNDEK